MKINLEDYDIDKDEIDTLKSLLAKLPHEITSKDIWSIEDEIWDYYKCSNTKYSEIKYSKFYSHPVWTIAGLFTDKDHQSSINRSEISNYINNLDVKYVLDCGGGFGSLARAIVDKNPKINVDIYEKYPTKIGKKLIDKYDNISYVDSFNKNIYNLLVSTDVIEHVHDPIKFLYSISNSINRNGYIILAGCFMPVCKCHIKSTFHLRYTLPVFCRMMGLTYIERCGNSHAHVYKKSSLKEPNWIFIRLLIIVSKLIYFSINPMHHQLSYIKRYIKKVIS
tara:strand:- start:1220 stop:2056 length:837 start_codon:yes stop_codon:yes gene_type:complete